MGFVHHCPRPGGSGLYHYALILYHLTTARGLGSGARSVSENANVNSRRFGSPPAEICGDLREHCCGSQRLETPLVARRSGRGGAVVVASPPAARRWPVGGLDRRTETVTRAGCGVRWYWWRLAWHADVTPTSPPTGVQPGSLSAHAAAWASQAPESRPSSSSDDAHASTSLPLSSWPPSSGRAPSVAALSSAAREPIRTHRTPKAWN